MAELINNPSTGSLLGIANLAVEAYIYKLFNARITALEERGAGGRGLSGSAPSSSSTSELYARIETLEEKARRGEKRMDRIERLLNQEMEPKGRTIAPRETRRVSAEPSPASSGKHSIAASIPVAVPRRPPYRQPLNISDSDDEDVKTALSILRSMKD